MDEASGSNQVPDECNYESSTTGSNAAVDEVDIAVEVVDGDNQLVNNPADPFQQPSPLVVGEDSGEESDDDSFHSINNIQLADIDTSSDTDEPDTDEDMEPLELAGQDDEPGQPFVNEEFGEDFENNFVIVVST